MTKWWSMSNFKVAFFFYFPAVRKTWPDVAKMTKSNNRLIEMAEFNVVYLSSVCVVWVDWWTRLGTSRRSSPVNHIDVCVCVWSTLNCRNQWLVGDEILVLPKLLSVERHVNDSTGSATATSIDGRRTGHTHDRLTLTMEWYRHQCLCQQRNLTDDGLASRCLHTRLVAHSTRRYAFVLENEKMISKCDTVGMFYHDDDGQRRRPAIRSRRWKRIGNEREKIPKIKQSTGRCNAPAMEAKAETPSLLCVRWKSDGDGRRRTERDHPASRPLEILFSSRLFSSSLKWIVPIKMRGGGDFQFTVGPSTRFVTLTKRHTKNTIQDSIATIVQNCYFLIKSTNPNQQCRLHGGTSLYYFDIVSFQMCW